MTPQGLDAAGSGGGSAVVSIVAFIALTMRANPVNRWVLHPLARAYADMEGVELQCSFTAQLA